jgi:hypothetical protein
MRKTRFMTMLFLVWAIAFFFVPDFRQGLQVPLLRLSFEGAPGPYRTKTALCKIAAELSGLALWL